MTPLAITIGTLLVLLGVFSYTLTSTKSLTAFIPSVLGLLLLLAGVVGRKETLRRHAMHAAAGVSLLGLLGTFSGVVTLVGVLSGGTLQRPVAVVAQSITALLCSLFLIFAVRSFVAARRQRQKLESS